MKGFNQSGFVALAFILVGLIAIPGLAADKSKEEQTWFAERVTSGDTGFSLERFWSRGSLFRSEAVLGGQPMTTIVNETHYLMIDVLLARGISIERSARAKAKDKERGRPFALEAEKMIEAGGEQVSEEKYGLASETSVYAETEHTESPESPGIEQTLELIISGNSEAALSNLKKMVSTNPSDPDVWNAFSSYFSSTGKTGRANACEEKSQSLG